jgi:hypothetical protein
VYRSRSELIATAAGFLSEGLQAGERCWYVGRGSELAGLRSALRDLGVAVEAAERQGALRIFLPSDVYAAVQPFVPERLMQIFSDGISDALREGFRGFRAAGDMSWAASPELAEPLLEYEHLISTLLVNSNARGLCLFDESLMLPQRLDGLVAAHPLVATISGALLPNPQFDGTGREPRGH